jgi:hypothetical protein
VAPGKATVARVDDTTLSPGACDPMPAKDCGSKSLLHFVPTIWGADSGGFALHGSYWQFQPDAPFDNCLGFQTPKNLAGNGGTYNGWQFGDSIPWRETGDIATRPLSPQKLRVGRTYRFAAHRVIQLTDADLHGYVMSPNGVAGYLLLGGQTSITDNVSWQITLKRLG